MIIEINKLVYLKIFNIFLIVFLLFSVSAQEIDLSKGSIAVGSKTYKIFIGKNDLQNVRASHIAEGILITVNNDTTIIIENKKYVLPKDAKIWLMQNTDMIKVSSNKEFMIEGKKFNGTLSYKDSSYFKIIEGYFYDLFSGVRTAGKNIIVAYEKNISKLEGNALVIINGDEGQILLAKGKVTIEALELKCALEKGEVKILIGDKAYILFFGENSVAQLPGVRIEKGIAVENKNLLKETIGENSIVIHEGNNILEIDRNEEVHLYQLNQFSNVNVISYKEFMEEVTAEEKALIEHTYLAAFSAPSDSRQPLGEFLGSVLKTIGLREVFFDLIPVIRTKEDKIIYKIIENKSLTYDQKKDALIKAYKEGKISKNNLLQWAIIKGSAYREGTINDVYKKYGFKKAEEGLAKGEIKNIFQEAALAVGVSQKELEKSRMNALMNEVLGLPMGEIKIVGKMSGLLRTEIISVADDAAKIISKPTQEEIAEKIANAKNFQDLLEILDKSGGIMRSDGVLLTSEKLKVKIQRLKEGYWNEITGVTRNGGLRSKVAEILKKEEEFAEDIAKARDLDEIFESLEMSGGISRSDLVQQTPEDIKRYVEIARKGKLLEGNDPLDYITNNGNLRTRIKELFKQEVYIKERIKGFKDFQELFPLYKGSEYYIDRNFWITNRIPAPVQGIKIRVTTDAENAYDIIKIVKEICEEEKVTFKVPKNLFALEELNLGIMGDSQIGKIITIYPQNEQIGARIAKKIDNAIYNKGIRVKIMPPKSDIPIPKSKSKAISFRYATNSKFIKTDIFYIDEFGIKNRLEIYDEWIRRTPADQLEQKLIDIYTKYYKNPELGKAAYRWLKSKEDSFKSLF